MHVGVFGWLGSSLMLLQNIYTHQLVVMLCKFGRPTKFDGRHMSDKKIIVGEKKETQKMDREEKTQKTIQLQFW